MSLAWRLLTSSALVAGLTCFASGCKSGGGFWSPGWAKAGPAASDLAVSRPTTRVPTPSSNATPTTAGSLASTGTAGAQDGPYGAAASAASSQADAYGSQPANFQGEPHSSVAPAGGYQTGGPYGMASTPAQPGVTPGAYAQPTNPPSSYAGGESAAQPSGTYPQVGAGSSGYTGPGEPSGSAYADANANAGAAAEVAEADSTSIYHDPTASGAGASQTYAAPDAAAAYGTSPEYGSSTGPAQAMTPANETDYGDSQYATDQAEMGNPAQTASAVASQQPIANPYSLPSTAPSTTPPPTSPSSSTSVATSTPAFTPPTLPSSLSGTPGSYRPGSTASPGSVYGTGYTTADGTMLR